MIKAKYPRTPHVFWSRKDGVDLFRDNAEVVVTEKIDGENTTIYPDGTYHARSIDSPNTWWRKPLWADASAIKSLGAEYIWCGENITAPHTITYNDLPKFMIFGIRSESNWLSWDETVDLCRLVEIPTVPVLYRGPFKEFRQNLPKDSATSEGYVIRNAGQFPVALFASNVAKYVKSGFIQTDQHWLFGRKPRR